MTDDQQILREIERDERWLDSVCEPSASIDAEPIKQRIRIELGERWLAEHMEKEAPRAALRRLCGRLNQSLQVHKGRGAVGGQSNRGQLKRMLVVARRTLGLAAALAFAWAGWLYWSTSTSDFQPDVVLVESFEQSGESESFDLALDGLRSEIEQMESTIASGLSASIWESEDWSGGFESSMNDGGSDSTSPRSQTSNNQSGV